ncbi:pollen receptor-like kinase 5 [Triticum dicoccoides]|uniref:pollen receptor-like kinase 5 n=1 Tax=Triticum dicoccoides TaxID=85692 RepID=UPI001890F165|nr:pollen receptor-like kinase 5 [Triticum dicoccoides]
MLYLSRNRFSGEIPADTFLPMRGLRKLHLHRNDFSGRVPSSITSPRLLELTLANNRFEGPLPDFSQPELRFVDVSNNNLSGPIPAGLGRFNATMFRGNKFLCGKPTDMVCESASSPAGGMPTFMSIIILLIILGVLLAAAGIAMGVLGRRRRRRRRAKRTDGCVTLPNGEVTPSNPVLDTAPAVSISQATAVGPAATSGGGPAKRGGRRDEHGRLVFIQESRVRFEIEDLLRASAEVLGSGNFGSSYKATLQEGPEVVVKRFKDMNGVGREDFSEHMRRLGRLSHPNLVPLVAYLYKKEEKLLITDFVINGSLAQLLHGNRGSMLDWRKRLRIVKGAARGLSHLYEELPMLSVPHGHLKSSNVLLDGTFQPALSDYALVPLLTATHAAQVMMAYKAPECVGSHGKPSRKSDVWSLGILTLEVLTGKFPACRQGRQGTNDLAGWVNSVITEERTGEVFDKDMSGGKGNEEEMLKLLQVALTCCEADIDKRLDLKSALAGIEEIREPEPESSSTLTGEGESKS